MRGKAAGRGLIRAWIDVDVRKKHELRAACQQENVLICEHLYWRLCAEISTLMARIKIARKNVIGPELCRLRVRVGLSQEELAAKCQLRGWDITRLTITRIEARARLVADYEILLLAEVLRVNPMALLPYKTNLRRLMPDGGIRKQET